METTFGARFKSLLDAYDITPSKAATRIGLSRQVIDSYLKGTVPRYDQLVAIIRAFSEVDIRWLILGDDVVPDDEPKEDGKGKERGLAMWDYRDIFRMWEEDRSELIRIRKINIELTRTIIKPEEGEKQNRKPEPIRKNEPIRKFKPN